MTDATSVGRLWPALAAVVFVLALARLAGVSAEQLRSPYDLLYESPSLGTIRIIESGRSPYDAAVYAGPPFTLTPYTPLYFYAMALLPAAPARPFLAGRIVSLLSIATCVVVLAVCARRATAALLATSCFLFAWPVTAHATYLRMDPPALALSALCLALLRVPTRRRVELAAVLAVLAVACKQTYLSAGVAGALYLLLRDRALALRFAAVAAGAGLALAALASWVWGSGFWFSIFVLRSSPIRLETFWLQAGPQLRAPIFLALLLVAAVAGGLAFRRHGAALLARSPAPLYLLCSTAVLLATLGKEGSSSIYFLELALALPLWLTDPSVTELPAARVRLAVPVLLVCVALELVTQESHRARFQLASNTAQEEGAYYSTTRTLLERAGYGSPRVLNLGPPRHAYGIADEICMNDVSTYDQAFEQHALEPGPLEAAIRARTYDVVMVTSFATPERMQGRPMKGAIEAVHESYGLLWEDAVYAFYGR